MAEPFGNPTDAQIAAQLGARGLPSPLAAYIPQLRALARRYNVPIAIVLAHLAVESGYGTDDNKLTRVFNYWGLTGEGSQGHVTIVTPQGRVINFAAFGSVEEGMDAAIRNMGSQGYQGLTLWQYFARYLTGDPNGTDDGAGNNVADYVNTALGIILKFGGSADKNTVVVPGSPLPGPAPSPAPPGAITPIDPLGGVAGAVQGAIGAILAGYLAQFKAFWTRERLIRIAVVIIGAVLLLEGLLFIASPAIFGAAHAVEGAV